jgi:rSAM/selenodomain-associated transferase 1
VLIMVKEPRPGRVKTRLARGIGAVAAARWFRHQTAALIRRLAADPRWEVILLVSPDREGAESRVWRPGLRRMAQGRGDLGARMARALRGAPSGPVVLIGGDIPGAAPAHIARAFAALGRAEAAFGPATDGGFWLVGLARGGRAAPPGFLGGCRWSTAHALTDAEASAAPLTTARVDTLSDVDDAADLAAIRR